MLTLPLSDAIFQAKGGEIMTFSERIALTRFAKSAG